VNSQPFFFGVRGGTFEAPAGTLWVCGDNNNGGLGTGNTTAYSSPVQIGSLTNWSKVEAGLMGGCAVKTDGTAWAWGYGYQGLNMDSSATTVSSPVQIGSLTDWSIIKKPSRFITMAIKTDGTVWAAGVHTVICGSTSLAKSSPVQIGTSTGWLSIGSSYGATSYGIIGEGPVCP
jgi:alpha-tubulin suppressor-like RCC1 family protein